MTTETSKALGVHTCSYACERPECIRAQRDELASRVAAETSNAREWVLVPREPTEAMLEAFNDWRPTEGNKYAGAQSVSAQDRWEFRQRYDAMLAVVLLFVVARGDVRGLVADIAQQTPEKPDYWNSCSQCERNIDRAQEALAAEGVQAGEVGK